MTGKTTEPQYFTIRVGGITHTAVLCSQPVTLCGFDLWEYPFTHNFASTAKEALARAEFLNCRECFHSLVRAHVPEKGKA